MNEKSFGGGTGTALDNIPQPPCAAFLGYELLSVDRKAQTMRVGFQGTKAMLNPRGGVQGGFLTAMLDDASGSMVVVLTDGAKGPASVDIHTQYFKPAGAERLICEAEIVHMGRSTVFTRATLYNEAGEKVAAATQTARLLDLTGAG
ncbi:PaaI family thioesterase [Hyphococcus sp.]|uniref:PaaI family thioesterase n=1 Tax=Hyphococcus sp. TaxID=2038636 RepID=UPI003CCB7AF7